MDWARAKNILIFIFLFLNLFLFLMMVKFFNSDKLSDETIDNARKVLEDRGIAIECDIPLYNKPIGTLTNANISIDKNLIIKAFFGDEKYTEENIDLSTVVVSGNKKLLIDEFNSFVYSNSSPNEITFLSDSKSVHNYLSNLSKRLNLTFKNFYIDKTEDISNDQKKYTFRQKKNKFWLYSNYVEITVGKAGVTYLKYNIRNSGEFTEGKKIMPAYQILLKNLIYDSGVVISKIDLGFGEQNMGKDTKVLDDLPVWRVTLKKGEKIVERYYKVYNGEEVKLNDK